MLEKLNNIEYVNDAYICKYTLDSPRSELYSNHIHSGFELIYILKGVVAYGYEGNIVTLKKNDIIITPPLVHHFLQTSTEDYYERIKIIVYPKKLNETIDINNVMIIDKYKSSVIYNIFDNLFYYLSVLEIADCKKILDLKIRELIFVLNKCTGTKQTPPDSLSPTMEKILSYINENIKKSITVKDVSQHCYLSEGHLHYLFKSQMKTTPMSYIKTKKMIIAQNMLSAGTKTATEVAHELGFEDYSVFYRNYVGMFKQNPRSLLNTLT